MRLLTVLLLLASYPPLLSFGAEIPACPAGGCLAAMQAGSGPPAATSAEPVPNITDAQRSALAITSYDLDLHLAPEEAKISALARIGVRNRGPEPISLLPLQISSTLHWESFSVRRNGRIETLSFDQHSIQTDADHTGAVQEGIVHLSEPLPPGASVDLTSAYSGEIHRSAERLSRLSIKPTEASFRDWDEIGPETTALRGFGHVLWFPVAARQAFLGDSSELHDAEGKQRQQSRAAPFRLRLSVSFRGEAPAAAYFCGLPQPIVSVRDDSNAPIAESQGVATAEWRLPRLGFQSPNLFVTATSARTKGKLVSAVTERDDNEGGLELYSDAAELLRPLLAQWLGEHPAQDLTILDHAGERFEDNAFAVMPMGMNGTLAPAPDDLAPELAVPLAHAFFHSPQLWLDEGVPQLMELLWTEQRAGRAAAQAQFAPDLGALQLAEADTGEGPPEGVKSKEDDSLNRGSREVFYRTKAAAVLLMLRSVVGDANLQHALRELRREPKLDADPTGFQRALEEVAHRRLDWIFDDWVYTDKGLPDLRVISAISRPLPAGNTGALVVVAVHNDGRASAEVPVTVRSGTLTATERLLVLGRSSASVRIVFEGQPQEVQVNDGSVPEIAESRHVVAIQPR